MCFAVRERAVGRCGIGAALALALAGCMGSGGGDPQVTAVSAAAPAAGEEIDVRRYIGPDYCPEIRIREGTELLRRYEAGHDEEAAFVVWQASIGKTARECLYDLQGNLTLRIGVSGRVVSGPKGGAQGVALPLRISVVKYKETLLANELYPLNVAMAAQNSAVFTEVREVTVPSPGQARDYLIYVGLDEKGENLLDPSKPAIAAKPKPAPKKVAPIVEEPVVAQPVRKRQPAPPKPAAQPNMLPTPSSGFVLPSG